MTKYPVNKAFITLALKTEGAIQIGDSTYEVPMAWAPGMVGVLPVFESEADAKAYAGEEYTVCPITFPEKSKDAG